MLLTAGLTLPPVLSPLQPYPVLPPVPREPAATAAGAVPAVSRRKPGRVMPVRDHPPHPALPCRIENDVHQYPSLKIFSGTSLIGWLIGWLGLPLTEFARCEGEASGTLPAPGVTPIRGGWAGSWEGGWRAAIVSRLMAASLTFASVHAALHCIAISLRDCSAHWAAIPVSVTG